MDELLATNALIYIALVAVATAVVGGGIDVATLRGLGSAELPYTLK